MDFFASTFSCGELRFAVQFAGRFCVSIKVVQMTVLLALGFSSMHLGKNKADRHKSRAYTDTTTTITDSQQLTHFKNLLTDKHIIVY